MNGPNEGPPEYEILPTMWDEYVKNLEAGVFDQETAAEQEIPETDIIPEQEVGPIRRKRTRRDFMMEETGKVVGQSPPKRTRAAEAVAKQAAEQESVPITRKSTCRKK